MGIAELDNEHLLLTIQAHIVLYGDAANEMLARQVEEEIESHWNSADARVIIRNNQYRVQFKITSTYNPYLKPSIFMKMMIL